ncbi:4-aminobutyrate aminotransferase-like enzyme/Ser/Thr protein kinase RdoA (MazF antagonist) [Curtobacterium luteum]|uniref:4-aminobutyrate aminotransferase n=1 Tax=Curtobacterium luteum TaxID=33881 RepID=A0A8H9GA48_9MICO|nr:aminotransferase [Curtobacterium luteum]MBM7804004.1 4-aminobutyrate aminotransferase-like enzyme/Ser/Thr protein kinase RdoA (MazF antagonist) [Curtobacterium luteum]NUU49266.1 aminotransferase [Curtobacterium luteum]GGK96954.1 4-aminobutyrate aminotransferase [Curtobacterium luteum]
MHSAVFDYFSQPELPSPVLPTAEATELLATEFGIDATLESLGSQQDQNFLVRTTGTTGTTDSDQPLGVLKISNPCFTEAEIDLQGVAAARVAAEQPGVRVPTVLASGWWDTSAGRLHARVISFVSGNTLTGSGYLRPAVVARLGALAARVQLALAGLEHPAAHRTLQWDLRHAVRVARTIAETEPDRAVVDEVLAAVDSAATVVEALGDRLPRQLGHFDVTDDNVLRPDGPVTLPDAVIDFGDVADSWAVGELAVTLSSVLHHDGATVWSVLPAVRVFHALRPLSSDEVDALWPLVVLRGAVLVLSGRQQVRLDDDNAYASGALDREYRVFRQAVSVPSAVVTGVLRRALGFPPATSLTWTRQVLDVEPVLLDGGTTSPVYDDGRWTAPDALAAEARRLLDAGAPAVVLPAWTPVLTSAAIGAEEAPASVPTGATLWLAEPTTIARERCDQGGAVLQFDPADRVDDGLVLPAGVPVHVRVVAAERGDADLPRSVPAVAAPGWRTLLGDPAVALGAPQQAPPAPDDLLARRDRVLAEVQEHYYAEPPRIERGWRDLLVDVDGRVYTDLVNNVASVGHAHPHVAAAAARQHRLLNTNSRFHYAGIVEYAERVAGLLPDELDTVFFVNSGSEATDLALRIAMAATGRTDVVAMREAYHGWTYASDAVSTSIADNPNALATRPAWVHTVDAANAYRGVHRGADASRYAPEAAERIRALAAAGHGIAGFICEPVYGNAGGIALPDGYLREVYDAVHEVGGLTIADEVQVGFGRLGHWFWGFEQQGVVPDVVAVAKSVGGGTPIGIVVTRREIADRYRTQGYFFSSTGGSPVSAAVGAAVLDVIESEGLQQNAVVVGEHLADRLRALGDRHALVGTVHGSGLYLGLEFVRDRTTLEPATEETAAICDRLLTLGIVMQPTGDHQNVLKIKPPLVVTRESADRFVDALDRVLTTGW